MTEIGDESDDVRSLRDALELRPDEIDPEARERHLARALDEFDDSPARTAARVVPMRQRRIAVVAAAAAVVLAVAGVGAVLANRGSDGTVATRAEAPTTAAPTTTAATASTTAAAAATTAIRR